MPRIPDTEIERLKASISIVRLIESAGIVLKPHGRDQVGRCPFHEDKTPSLVVSAKTNLWHCLGACQVGGSVIDWVMKREGVSFREAVERLRDVAGAASTSTAASALHTDALDAPLPSKPGPARGSARLHQATASSALPPASLIASDDQALLDQVIDYYHQTLRASPEALAYLAKRGIDALAAIQHFKLGFGNRTLGYSLPKMIVKAGAAVRGALQRIGLYRSSGHEHFNGSLVIPVMNLDGHVTEVYGRKITRELRTGTPLHLYLPGPHRGVFNEAGLVGNDEVILCESLIDALTFWCAGYRNVTSSYGIEGFTEDHLTTFRRHGVQRVLIAYDADAAGDAAAKKLAATLMAAGIACYRIVFPNGMDANEFALAERPAAASLGKLIRNARWLGPSAAPATGPTSIAQPDLVIDAVADVVESIAVDAVRSRSLAPVLPLVAAVDPEPLPELPASPAAPLPRALAAKVDERELVLEFGDRRYRARGMGRNLSYDSLKVNLQVSRGARFHLDTLDLYQAKQRAAFIHQASVEIEVEAEVVKADLGRVLQALEGAQDTAIKAQLKPSGALPAAVLTPQQEDAAMSLLRDPHLIERIVADVEAIGVVGEASNALVAYLACVSRKLDKPLAILIQSTSAAGKSTLMDALLSLMPEAERVHYSAMTGQSLFYLGETSMKHKILAIAEEEGVRQAAYALKLLQSQGELTIASTGKDPATGQLETQTYKVEGPVMLFLTTTAIDIDEELLNRCLVLTINESREQTAAIQAKQRASRTLAGLLTKARSDEVLAAHRSAQTLLRPLAVVNPFAEQLTFASDRVRLRRDHQKYLALIDSIALLHQYQRPVRTASHAGTAIEYIEVTLADIALANRLAHEVLGRSLDELPPQTRRVLGYMQQFVAAQAQAQAMERTAVRFTRRAMRDALGMSEKQLRVHVDRLVEGEYVIAHAGRNGQRFVYELAFDGDVADSAPQAIGLVADSNLVGVNANLVGSKANLVPHSWPARGDLVATSSSAEIPRIASAGADVLPLVAAVAENALLGAPRANRSNGGSYS